jgi:exonuclease SbcC
MREYEKLLGEKTQLEKTAEKELKLQAELEEQSEIENFTIQVLNLLKNAGEQVAQVYRARLSQRAEAIYRQITSEPVRLEWTEDYDIRLSDIYDKAERIRAFKQLSGGEQMAAALAVRLGLIEFSRLKLAFFDEPTSNLDAVRRSSLADMFQRIPGELEQIFIISHDDTFDTITQNVILL